MGKCAWYRRCNPMVATAELCVSILAGPLTNMSWRWWLKKVNEIQPFIKIGYCGAVIGQIEIMHHSLAPEKPLATHLKDKVDLTNQRVSLPAARAQGKGDWATNEKLTQSSFVVGRTNIVLSARRLVDDHRHVVFFFVWIFLLHSLDIKKVYIQTR